jgi:hypothetical protein
VAGLTETRGPAGLDDGGRLVALRGVELLEPRADE